MKVGEEFLFSLQYECYFMHDTSVTLHTKCNTVSDFVHTLKKESLYSIAGTIGISLVHDSHILQRHKGTLHYKNAV